MSSDSSSIEYSDIDYENSSDSGFSVTSSDVCIESVFSQVWILLLFSIQLVIPSYPIIDEAPVQQVKSSHLLIKWSLPPPSAPLVHLPGWNAMPYGLQRFWHSAFCWFFRPFLATHEHLWTLDTGVNATFSVDRRVAMALDFLLDKSSIPVQV